MEAEATPEALPGGNSPPTSDSSEHTKAEETDEWSIKVEEVDITSELLDADENTDSQPAEDTSQHVVKKRKGLAGHWSTTLKLDNRRSKRKFKCYLCPRSAILELQTDDALRSHLTTFHEQKETYRCNECELSMEGIELFNQHLQSHDIHDRPFLCDDCPRRFRRLFAVQRHAAAVHKKIDEQLKPYKCRACPSRFITLGRVRHHEAYKHGLAMPEPDSFKRQAGLRRCLMCKEKVHVVLWDKHVCVRSGQEMKNALLASRSETEHKCYLCPSKTVLEDGESLGRHLETVHDKEDVYYCKECKVSIFKIQEFNRHLRGHDPYVRPYKCTFCPQRFTLDQSRKRHETKQHKNKGNDSSVEIVGSEGSNSRKTTTCYICSPILRLKSIITLCSHLHNNHPLQDQYHCSECNSRIPTRLAFNQHLAEHAEGTTPLRCIVRPVNHSTAKLVKHVQKTVQNLRSGRKQHEATAQDTTQDNCFEGQASTTSIIQLELTCFLCESKPVWKSKQLLQQHLKTVHTPEIPEEQMVPPTPPAAVKKFNCYVCDPMKNFPDNKSFRKHLRVSHRAQKSFTCPECNSSFQHIRPFNAHLQRHDPEERPFKCAMCPIRFTRPVHKGRHERFVHQLMEKCPHCAKVVRSGGLDHHVKKFHSRVKTVLETNSQRGNHMKRISTSDHPPNSSAITHGTVLSAHSRVLKRLRIGHGTLKCYLCKDNVPLFSKAALKHHLKTVHPGAQSVYSCEECPYSTRKLHNFNHHQSRHDRSRKLFKCRSCRMRFPTVQFRRNHEICMHSQTSDNSCVVCDKQFSRKYKLKLHEKVDPHCSAIIRQTEAKILGDEFGFFMTEIPPPTVDAAVKRFRCLVCNPPCQFESRDSLAQHLSSHPAREMYHCSSCSFSSSAITVFNQHLSQHVEIMSSVPE